MFEEIKPANTKHFGQMSHTPKGTSQTDMKEFTMSHSAVGPEAD